MSDRDNTDIVDIDVFWEKEREKERRIQERKEEFERLYKEFEESYKKLIELRKFANEKLLKIFNSWYTESFFKRRTSQKNYLYICVGNEPNLAPSIEEFFQIVKKLNPAGLKWDYKIMKNENHRTIKNISLDAGLRSLFKNVNK